MRNNAQTSLFPTFPRYTFAGTDPNIRFGVLSVFEDMTIEAKLARWETPEQAKAWDDFGQAPEDLLETVGLMWVGSTLFWFDSVCLFDWVMVKDGAGRPSSSILDIPSCEAFQAFISTDSPRKPANKAKKVAA